MFAHERVFLFQSWVDRLISWDPADFGNVTHFTISPLKIWVPDIVVYNRFSSPSLHSLSNHFSFGNQSKSWALRCLAQVSRRISLITTEIFHGAKHHHFSRSLSHNKTKIPENKLPKFFANCNQKRFF